jgi:hypothetical protein
MNLRQEILKEHSKAQCEKIVHWVGGSQIRFDDLFRLFLEGEKIEAQRAAWPVSYCVIAHPAFISKHFAALLNNLKKSNLHNAVKRNSIRLLQHVQVPERYHGDVMNICFDYLASPLEPVAVKAFSLTVLANLAKYYPGIVQEIKLLIESQFSGQTAGFKSRAKKILQQLGS